METSTENLRFYILVEAKRGVVAKDILQHLRDVFGNAAPASSFVYKWYSNFVSGERSSVKTMPRSGRPVSQRCQTNISRVFDFVDAEPKSSLRCIAEALGLSKDTVRRILVDDLMFRNVCSVWIPHKLSDDNRQQRLECCRSLLETMEIYSEYELLRVWATQDETWVPFELLGSKQENMVWIAPQTPRPQVVRPQLTFQKTMLSLVFTGNGKIWVDVTDKGETVDSERYVTFVHQTGEHWRKLHSDPTCLKELLWQHDNARPHTAVNTRAFFNKRRMALIKQAPYSPDLNQCDRWLFKLLKTGLKQRTLACAEDVRKAALELFHKIPPQRFVNELENLKKHCHDVIVRHGDYVTNR
jgi:histone-lysine N-methyltransferase SETMAR